MAPKLAAFDDHITQNAKLFARIDAVYTSPAKATLTPEQQRLVWVYWKRFVRAGAKLSPADKATFAANNQKLGVALHQVRAERARRRGELCPRRSTAPAQLAGLPQAQIDAAAAEGASAASRASG